MSLAHLHLISASYLSLTANFTQHKQKQIVVHTGKQMDGFVTIRTVSGDSLNHYIQCPEKFLMEVIEAA